MSIDLTTVEQQVLAAMNAAAGSAAPANRVALQQLAVNFATALATIEADHAAGTLTDAQAKALIQGAVDGAEAVLIGLAAPTAQAIVSAALNTLLTVAGAATGLGWAVPIVQAVLGAL